MKYRIYILQLAQKYSYKDLTIVENTTFEDMGLDSYDIVDFLVEVEEHCDVFIPNDEMLQLKSIQDVLNTIDQYSQEENK